MAMSMTQPEQDEQSLDRAVWKVFEGADFIGYRTTHLLRDAGFETVEDIYTSPVLELTYIDGIDEQLAKRMKIHVGDLTAIDRVGTQRASILLSFGVDPQKIEQYTVDELAQLPSIGEPIAERILAVANGTAE